MMGKENWKIYLMLILATSIWGSAFLAGSVATEELSPITVAFLRFLGAAIILFPFMWYKEPNRPRISMRDWIFFILLGLTGIFLYNIFFFLATKYVPIIKSSLFIATNPVLIVLLSAVFLKEKISIRQIIGLLLALLGGFYIIVNGDFEQFAHLGFTKMDLVLLGAVISWASYTVLGKVVLRKFSSLVSTTYAVGFGTLFLFPFALAETTWRELAQTTWPTWIAIIDLAVLVTVISFILWYEGVKLIGASKSAIFINFMPLSAVIMAILFRGEYFAVHHFIGAILVILGVYISSLSKRSFGRHSH
jgi:drug/metabolite transporter (DMT)-like permease